MLSFFDLLCIIDKSIQTPIKSNYAHVETNPNIFVGANYAVSKNTSYFEIGRPTVTPSRNEGSVPLGFEMLRFSSAWQDCDPEYDPSYFLKLHYRAHRQFWLFTPQPEIP